MALDFAADLAAVYEDAGVEVVYGTQTTFGCLNQVDEAVFPDASVIGRSTVLQIVTGSLTGILVGEEITVDGQAYRIVQPPRAVGDGMETVIQLGDV